MTLRFVPQILAAIALTACIPIGEAEHAQRLDPDNDGAVWPDDCDNGDPTVLAAQTWFLDGDGDGYGTDAETTESCSVPPGFAGNADDCDDASAANSPDGTELCDGVDNDCDGDLDEDDAADAAEWYPDADNDGYGVPGTTVFACSKPAGYAAEDTDCDDSNPSLSPGFNSCSWLIGGGTDLDRVNSAFLGITAGDRAGTSVAGAGDLDNDNKDDVLIGAPEESTEGADAGAVYVVHGPAVSADLASSAAILFGETFGDRAGFAVAGVGDLGGDVHADIAIGAPGESTVAPDAGVVYIVHSPIEGEKSLGLADAILSGTGVRGEFGWSVAGGVDLTGDNNDDLVVGAPLLDTAFTDAGAVYLFAGPLSGELTTDDAVAMLTGENEDDAAGTSVSMSGDVNADGVDDLLIGAPLDDETGINAGAVYLVLGPVAGDLSLDLADAKFSGEVAGDLTGTSVAIAGDINKDGKDDLMIGSAYQGTAGTAVGTAYLVLGSQTVAGGSLGDADATFVAATGAPHPLTVTRAGDVDNDAHADIAVGVDWDGTNGARSGSVYLAFGPVDPGGYALDDLEGKAIGVAAGHEAGSALAGVGYVNGDAFADLVVGAPGHDGNGSGAGAAYLLLGLRP